MGLYGHKISRPRKGQTCAGENQCENTWDVFKPTKKKLRLDNAFGLAIFSVYICIVFIFGTFYSELKLTETVERVKEMWFGKREEGIIESRSVFVTYARNRQRLGHVFSVLKSINFIEYEFDVNQWDLFYAVEVPFFTKGAFLSNLSWHQKVNHFAGMAYLTNKVELSTSNNRFVPKSFRIPQQNKEFLKYYRENPNTTFMEKGIHHRRIKVRNIKQFNFGDSNHFIQEFIGNPLLISGHKFDLGVYTIITSLDPLRIYIYNGEILIRFCTSKYHPFNPLHVDKYVLTEKYLPSWEVPSIAPYLKAFGYGMRDSFNLHFTKSGADPDKIWNQIEEAISETVVEGIRKMKRHRYPLTRNFFEIVRVDFIVDDAFRVYLIEYNSSPNLCSKELPTNALLYDQLLYNSFSLLGIAQRVKKQSLKKRYIYEEMMQSAERNIMVNNDACIINNCKTRCNATECTLCRDCLDLEMIEQLHDAYREHINRIECKRVFPPKMDGKGLSTEFLEKFSPRNQILLKWFNAKCKEDKTWC